MHPTLEAIQAASKDLQYRSETDAPLTVITLPPTDDVATVLRQRSGKEDAPVETVSLQHFFRNHVKTWPGEGGEAAALAQKFTALEALLEQSLSGIQVYRIGSVQVDAYIIGQLPDGSYGGLKTQLVET